MGMFDYFRSSYDLGEEFTNVECQTKDMEKHDLGGSMSNYWLDPHGYLYWVDYSNTQMFQTIPKKDPRYNSKFIFMNHEYVPTGKHGKVRPYLLTKYVEIYPANYYGDPRHWPRLSIHFKSGRLVDFERID